MQVSAVKIAERLPVLAKTEIRHGFDGQPPELITARDFRGDNVRELPERQNANSDRLHWLWCHDKISDAQYFAGKKLQADAQLAQIGTFAVSSIGAIRSVSHVPSNLPDSKLDAIARVNRARASMAATAWRLLDLVVVENIQPAEAGRRLWGRAERGVALGALRFALDWLAQHYGLV